MCGNKQYENICKDEFGQLHRKLDSLDESIRGNGKPGINTRLDRLEQAAVKRSRLFWMIVGAVVSAVVIMLFK
ncbi:MAG: hypothetical protein ACIAQZ_12295 [Sedimentisphaeraceae bacterium JB056]